MQRDAMHDSGSSPDPPGEPDPRHRGSPPRAVRPRGARPPRADAVAVGARARALADGGRVHRGGRRPGAGTGLPRGGAFRPGRSRRGAGQPAPPRDEALHAREGAGLPAGRGDSRQAVGAGLAPGRTALRQRRAVTCSLDRPTITRRHPARTPAITARPPESGAASATSAGTPSHPRRRRPASSRSAAGRRPPSCPAAPGRPATRPARRPGPRRRRSPPSGPGLGATRPTTTRVATATSSAAAVTSHPARRTRAAPSSAAVPIGMTCSVSARTRSATPTPGYRGVVIGGVRAGTGPTPPRAARTAARGLRRRACVPTPSSRSSGPRAPRDGGWRSSCSSFLSLRSCSPCSERAGCPRTRPRRRARPPLG